MPIYQHWILKTDERIATLTLNRPEWNNSITTEVLRELNGITTVLAGDIDISAVILRGEGRHFSSGADPALFQAMLNQPEEAFRRELAEMQNALDEFERLPQPTIAQLHGFCLGGGLLLALCCDFRIASQRTVFAFPEIRVGISPLWGTHRIPRAVGALRARELVLLGERFNARTALEYRLINQVVPPDELDRAVEDLTDKLQRLPPGSVRMVKRVLTQCEYLAPEESQKMEMEAQVELLGSPELRAAVKGYLKEVRREEEDTETG